MHRVDIAILTSILFLLITRKDTDLADIYDQVAVKDGITERTCTPYDRQYFLLKYVIFYTAFCFLDTVNDPSDRRRKQFSAKNEL